MNVCYYANAPPNVLNDPLPMFGFYRLGLFWKCYEGALPCLRQLEGNRFLHPHLGRRILHQTLEKGCLAWMLAHVPAASGNMSSFSTGFRLDSNV